MYSRIILLFLMLVIGSFDRHLAHYLPGEVMAMIHAHAVPSHADVPLKIFDYHEDIAIKSMSCIVPSPVEVPVQNGRIFHMPIPRISPHTVWQPPEFRI